MKKSVLLTLATVMTLNPISGAFASDRTQAVVVSTAQIRAALLADLRQKIADAEIKMQDLRKDLNTQDGITDSKANNIKIAGVILALTFVYTTFEVATNGKFTHPQAFGVGAYATMFSFGGVMVTLIDTANSSETARMITEAIDATQIELNDLKFKLVQLEDK